MAAGEFRRGLISVMTMPGKIGKMRAVVWSEASCLIAAASAGIERCESSELLDYLRCSSVVCGARLNHTPRAIDEGEIIVWQLLVCMSSYRRSIDGFPYPAQHTERGDASPFMYLGAAKSITSAAFSASAWLSMPQPSVSSIVFPHGRIPRSGEPSLVLQVLQRPLSETHTPGPNNGSRATFAAPGACAADSVFVTVRE